MSDEFDPAIAALRRRLDETERKANEIRRTINMLLTEAGRPPEFPDDDGGGNGGGQKITQIQGDTFYGKKMQTAAREYFEMRKIQNLGPAKPREVFEALKAGGYSFDTKDDNVAMISLRSMMRKRTNVFHQLPSGLYGLVKWYPDLKVPKAVADDEDDADDTEAETKTTTPKKGAVA